MKIVIDVGCARYGGDFSVERLIERFHPDVLYGFDPSWTPNMFTPWDGLQTSTVFSTEAAWTRKGEVRFMQDGLNGQVGDVDFWPLVRCFSLAKFISRWPTAEIILKLDCEGSEVPLLTDIRDKGMDERLSLVLVEWHCENCGKGGGHHSAQCPEPVIPKVEGLRCPVEEWLG